MIPESYKPDELIGKRAVVNSTLCNKGGQCIAIGTEVTIVGNGRHDTFSIQTDKCHVCGQFSVIVGVSREDLILAEER